MDAGLLLWNQTRQQWLGNKRLQSHPKGREPRIRWITSIDFYTVVMQVYMCNRKQILFISFCILLTSTLFQVLLFLIYARVFGGLESFIEHSTCNSYNPATEQGLVKRSVVEQLMINPLCLCSWNATYESLLATNKAFPQPVPLPVSFLWTRLFPQLLLLERDSTLFWLFTEFKWQEMVDFLVDVWEQEGLYDWARKLERTPKFSCPFFLYFFEVPICANYIQVLLYILYFCSSSLLRFFMNEPHEMHCVVSSRWLSVGVFYIQNTTCNSGDMHF